MANTAKYIRKMIKAGKSPERNYGDSLKSSFKKTERLLKHQRSAVNKYTQERIEGKPISVHPGKKADELYKKVPKSMKNSHMGRHLARQSKGYQILDRLIQFGGCNESLNNQILKIFLPYKSKHNQNILQMLSEVLKKLKTLFQKTQE